MTENEKKQFWKANIYPRLEEVKTMKLMESITVPGYVENSGCIVTRLPGGVCELQTETKTHLVAHRNVCIDIDAEINMLYEENEFDKLETILKERELKNEPEDTRKEE